MATIAILKVCAQSAFDTFKGVKQKDRVDFSLSHDNPYPTGDYKIDIYLNGELAETVEFTIE